MRAPKEYSGIPFFEKILNGKCEARPLDSRSTYKWNPNLPSTVINSPCEFNDSSTRWQSFKLTSSLWSPSIPWFPSRNTSHNQSCRYAVFRRKRRIGYSWVAVSQNLIADVCITGSAISGIRTRNFEEWIVQTKLDLCVYVWWTIYAEPLHR